MKKTTKTTKKAKVTANVQKPIKTFYGNAGSMKLIHNQDDPTAYYWYLRLAVENPQELPPEANGWLSVRLYKDTREIAEGQHYDAEKRVFIPTGIKIERGDRLRVTGRFEIRDWPSKDLGLLENQAYLSCYNRGDVEKVERVARPLKHTNAGF